MFEELEPNRAAVPSHDAACPNLPGGIPNAAVPTPPKLEVSPDDAILDSTAAGVEGAIESDPSELQDWKQEMRREFESWLEALDSIPDNYDGDDSSGPDLWSFYRDYAASNAEARKSNRRTAEVFSQWGDTLSRFDTELRVLREQLSRQASPSETCLPRPWCLSLVEVLDRLQRLAAAFRSPPPPRWWIPDSAWQRAWASQQQAVAILIAHTETMLSRAGITRIPTVGEIFEPRTMAAVATDSHSSRPPQTVLEEITAGYRLNNELLRVAEVRVSLRPQ